MESRYLGAQLQCVTASWWLDAHAECEPNPSRLLNIPDAHAQRRCVQLCHMTLTSFDHHFKANKGAEAGDILPTV